MSTVLINGLQAYLVLDHTVHSIFERYQKVRVIGTLEYLKNISNLHST